MLVYVIATCVPEVIRIKYLMFLRTVCLTRPYVSGVFAAIYLIPTLYGVANFTALINIRILIVNTNGLQF